MSHIQSAPSRERFCTYLLLDQDLNRQGTEAKHSTQRALAVRKHHSARKKGLGEIPSPPQRWVASIGVCQGTGKVGWVEGSFKKKGSMSSGHDVVPRRSSWHYPPQDHQKYLVSLLEECPIT